MSLPDTFYTIDVLFGLFVVLFGAAGLFRGLAGELARLLAFLFLFCGFALFFPSLTQFAARKWSALPPVAIQVVVGLILWLSALLLFLALRFVLRKVLCEQIAGVADKICGALMGMISGALLGLCVLSVVSLVPDESVYRKLSEKSMIGAWVCERMAPWLHPKMMELPVFNGEETE